MEQCLRRMGNVLLAKHLITTLPTNLLNYKIKKMPHAMWSKFETARRVTSLLGVPSCFKQSVVNTVPDFKQTDNVTVSRPTPVQSSQTLKL